MNDDEQLSRDQLLSEIAGRAGVTIEQVRKVLQAQAELACVHARQGYPIPGVGLLKLTDSPERRMVMRFGPDAGKEKLIPSRRVVKFRVAKITKDVVFGNPSAMPDIQSLEWYPSDDPVED
jgi:DNA-binding protein HU-beta